MDEMLKYEQMKADHTMEVIDLKAQALAFKRAFEDSEQKVVDRDDLIHILQAQVTRRGGKAKAKAKGEEAGEGSEDDASTIEALSVQVAVLLREKSAFEAKYKEALAIGETAAEETQAATRAIELAKAESEEGAQGIIPIFGYPIRPSPISPTPPPPYPIHLFP